MDDDSFTRFGERERQIAEELQKEKANQQAEKFATIFSGVCLIGGVVAGCYYWRTLYAYVRPWLPTG